MEENTENFNKVCEIIKSQQTITEDLIKKWQVPFTETEYDILKTDFAKITNNYYYSLTNLLNKLHLQTLQGCSDIEKKKYQYFNQILQKQISLVRQTPLLDDNYNIFINSKIIDFTPREIDILNCIYYFKLSYKDTYNLLGISKSTFDDHIERIAKKIYDHIQKEKEEYPNLEPLFPSYEIKEDTITRNNNSDYSETYARPFEVINNYLNTYF